MSKSLLTLRFAIDMDTGKEMSMTSGKSMGQEVLYVRQGKAIDISLLPPCQSSRRLHMLHSNVIAKIWKSSDEMCIHLPDVSTFGWKGNLNIDCQRQPFPNELTLGGIFGGKMIGTCHFGRQLGVIIPCHYLKKGPIIPCH